MTRVAITLAFAVAAATATALPAAADCAGTVVVDDVRFDPASLRVCEGGTVTWDVWEAGHTIAADDGRFAFRGDSGGTLSAGGTVSYTVGDSGEFIGYHCEIHPSMRGRIVVGDGPPTGPEPVLRVPQDEASLHDAVIRAKPGFTVEVAPGTYDLARTLVLDGDGVVLRGAGDTPEDVVLSGAAHLIHTVVDVAGAHVTLENLTVTGARTTGIRITGSAVGVHDVHVRGGPLTRDGIVLGGVSGAGLNQVVVSGVARAGVEVRSCSACGVALRGLDASDNLVGVHLRDATGVLVDQAMVTGNTTGIVAHGVTRPVAVEVRGSVVRDNDRPGAVAGHDDALLASGAGILLAGVVDSAVLGNQVSGHDGYGVVLAAGAAQRTRVIGNVATGNAPADLAWDGLGVQTCFSASGEPVTDPPTLLATAGCDAIAPASPPNPLITARVVTGGTP